MKAFWLLLIMLSISARSDVLDDFTLFSEPVQVERQHYAAMFLSGYPLWLEGIFRRDMDSVSPALNITYVQSKDSWSEMLGLVHAVAYGELDFHRRVIGYSYLGAGLAYQQAQEKRAVLASTTAAMGLRMKISGRLSMLAQARRVGLLGQDTRIVQDEGRRHFFDQLGIAFAYFF